MKVSVIVPVYNTEAYLRECLDSVLAQSHKDFEAILVDDGSTDGSGKICDSFAAADRRVRVLHCANGGLSVARNRGIAAAAGECVCFVDSDDAMHPDMLSVLCAAMESTRAEIAACSFFRGTDSAGFGPLPHKNPEIHSGKAAAAHFLYQHGNAGAGACGHLFSKRLFDENRMFTPGILYEDLDLVPRLYEIADCVAFVGLPLYFYRRTEGSIINTWSPRRLDVLDVTERLVRYFSNDGELLKAARDRQLSAAFNIFMLNARNGKDGEIETRALRIIRSLRRASLTNPRVRMKNKLGIVASYCGSRFLKFLSML